MAKVFELPFRRRFTDSTPLDGHWEGAGDILRRPDIAFPFCVECKKQEGWELDGMLANDKWPPWGWWDQAVTQAEKVGLHPLMIFARNLRQNYVLLKETTGIWLNLQPHHGPVTTVRRSSGESLVLALASDLVRVPAKRVNSLSTTRTNAPAVKSKGSLRKSLASLKVRHETFGVAP